MSHTEWPSVAASAIDTAAMGLADSDPFNVMNGLRVKEPGKPQIYLVDRGVRRHIPDRETYNLMFANWDNVKEHEHVANIPLGVPFPKGTRLLRAEGTNPVYLLDSGKRRWITNDQVRRHYDFTESVTLIPAIVLDAIPVGDTIEG